MPASTTNYSLNKPLVNSPTDADLWGAQLNTNMDTIDTQMLLNRDFKKLAKTTTYIVLAGDRHKIITCDASGGAFSVTMLPAATAGDGYTIIIVKTDSSANAVTIDGDGSETIGAATTFALSGEGDSAMLVCDGSNWNFGGNKTTPSGVSSATTTTEGIVEIATDAEFVTGADTSRSLTAASVKAGLGFTTYYESSEQTISSGSSTTLTHGLGAIPKFMIAELVCKTTDRGYAVDDRIVFTSVMGSSGSTSRQYMVTYNPTKIIISYDANVPIITSKTGGAAAGITTGSWRVVVRAWA